MSDDARYKSNRLAVDGGTPVRSTPLPWELPGAYFIDDEEKRLVTQVVEARSPFRFYGLDAQGMVDRLESEWCSTFGHKHALGVNSGSAALHIALCAFGVGPGDEVLVPGYMWVACISAIVRTGAIPRLVDIDTSFCMDPADLERKIGPRSKAVLFVNMSGAMGRIDRIAEICRKHNLRLLEDCAQAIGASLKGRPSGSYGDIGIYSLQMNKTITAGEGGAVVTSNPELFERASRFHDLGGLRAPHQELLGGKPALDWFIGTNFRMNELSGGVLLAQTRKLDRIVGSVRANAARVYEGIRDLPGLKLRRLPDPEGELGTGVFLDFGSRERCEKFLAAMKAENIAASRPGGSVILPTLPHIIAKKTIHPSWPSFQTARGKAMRYGPETCPRTIDILGRFGGVLMDPKYTRRDLDDIVAAIRKVYPAVVPAA